jgi:hypothetical protein
MNNLMANLVSRIGKFTQQKHLILKKKSEILSGNQKKHFVKQPGSYSAHKFEANAEEDLMRLEQNVKMLRSQTLRKPDTNQKNEEKKKPVKQFKFRPQTQSTPNMQVSTRGIKINYSLVEKKAPCFAWTLKKTESKKVVDKAQPPLRNIVMKDRQKGFINFKLMKDRPNFVSWNKGNPHPKRFNNINAFPSASTKSRRVVSSDFKKSLGRDDRKYQINLTPSVYEPPSDFTHAGVPFNKMLDRPPLLSMKKIAELNNNSVNMIGDNMKKYENKLSKYRSTSSPDFSKTQGRQAKGLRLAIFMDTCHSRMALNTINRNVFEGNQFHTIGGPRMYQTGGPGLFHSQSQASLMRNPNGMQKRQDLATSKTSQRSML